MYTKDCDTDGNDHNELMVIKQFQWQAKGLEQVPTLKSLVSISDVEVPPTDKHPHVWIDKRISHKDTRREVPSA